MIKNIKGIIEVAKLEDALFHAQDMLERSQIPFFALGNTAKHIYRDEGLDGDEEINIGVKKNETTDSQMKTLRSLIPDLSINEYQMSYTYNDVPILIDIIHTDYKVFQDPDVKWFKLEFFRFPNPFDEYWQRRDFIK